MKNSLSFEEAVHGTPEDLKPVTVEMIEYWNEHWYKINLDPIRYFSSVTTRLGIIDKPFLAKWRGDVGNREADYRMRDAAEKGSNIHHAWFVATTGGAVIYQSKRKPFFTQDQITEFHDNHAGNICVLHEQDEQLDVLKLQEWHNRIQPEYLHNEVIVYSLIHEDAGTCDKIIRILKEGFYEINGKTPLFLKAGIYIVDLKTGNVADFDMCGMQLAPYKEMAIEMGLCKREEVMGGLIVHTGSKIKSGIRGLATLLYSNEELDQYYTDYRKASDLWLRKHKDDKPEIFEFPSVITFASKKEE